MITRYRAWLNGQGLQDIDPTVIITDIQESIPDMKLETASRAHGDGLRVLRNTRRSLSVALRFAIYEYDVERRKAILQKVITWARKGGVLTINDRPGQQLSVVVEQLPVMSSALKWQAEMLIMLTAYETPFWQESIPARVSAYGENGSVQLYPAGNHESCVLEAKITNTGADTLNTLTIAANGREMAFSGLGIAPGETFTMAVEGGLLALPVANRTPESADEILLHCGEYNTITYTADQSVSAVFSARGAWL